MADKTEDIIREYFRYSSAVDVTDIAEIIRRFRALPQRTRAEAIAALGAFMCVSCGSDDPRCQCWNDE